MNEVMTINSYAGSLLLGAEAAGANVIASCEDIGFGSNMQEYHWPRVPHYRQPPWPEFDMSQRMIIAHPPCSAASTMNPVASTKGANSAAFGCTKRVLDYAVAHNTHTVAIESVVPACDMARSVHDEYAKKGGWNLYRIFQNAEHFGVPQHRLRFWAVFSKTSEFCADWKPRMKKLRDILGAPGVVADVHHRMLEAQSELLAKYGVNARDLWLGKLGHGLVRNMLKKLKLSKESAVHPTRFAVNTPYLLNPDGVSPCLLGGCAWYVSDEACPLGARPLTSGEYNLIMGFPADYWIQPERQRTTFLSKGVVPPVAQWIVKSCMNGGSDVRCQPGGILDLTEG